MRRRALKTIDHQGIKVQIDRPHGTTFGGTGPDGKPYSVTQQDDYGFLPGVLGDDGEEYDAYVGPSSLAASVYVVVQLKAATGEYDEQKAMLGYDSQEHAESVYRAHTAPSMFGGCLSLSVAEFKRQLSNRPSGKPFVATLQSSKSMTDAAKETAALPTGTRPGSLCVRAAPVSSVREDVREADFICSTDTRDSYGEIVRQNWNLNRFAGNPVALWSHQSHELPIGFWKNVRVEDGSLRGTLVVATAEANPKAENVWQSILQKTIRAVSVGFQPGKVTVEEIDGDEVVCLDDNTLFEISPTPLPANPEALIDVRRKAFDDFYATRGAVPYQAHPPTDTGKWDASATVKRLRAWASDGKGPDHIDWNKYRQCFAWVDPQRTHEFGGYKLPHHDVKDGKLITPRAGVVAAGDALTGARSGLKIPETDVSAVKKHLAQHYHQFDLKAPWENKSAPDGVATLGTTTGPAPATKKKESGVDEEAKKKSMITCPECGEKFDPEDEGDSDDEKSKCAKQFKQRLAEIVVSRSAPVIAERDSLKASVVDLTSKHAASEKALADERTKSDGLALKLVEAELTPLSGVKYAPGAHDGHVAIAKMYMSQGDAGQAKWKSHLDAIKGGPDLKILGATVTPTDPTPSGSQPTGDLTDLLNKSLSDKE